MSWPVVDLTDLCRPKQWPTVSKSELLDSGYPVYGANGRIGFYSEYNHEEPTILITCRGATCGTINVCDAQSYVTGNAMALDGLDRERVDLRFMVYALRQADFSAVITGVAQPQITRQTLSRLKIPLPPLAEQKRIAGILDAADALRAKRHEALAQLDTLLQATFLDLFGDPVTNPKGWAVKPLSELASVHRGKFTPRPRNDPSYYYGEYPFIQTGDIADSGGYVTSWRQTLNEKGTKVSKCFHPGTIVFAIVGATIGRTAILSISAYCPDSVVGIIAREKVATPVFLEAVLRSRREELLKRAPQTARANLNLEILKPFPLACPPFELQSRFQQIVQSADRQRAGMRAHLAELDTLFASLQSRAFRGEL